MLTSLCLLTCVLGVGGPTDSPESVLVPRLNRGLELVYSGKYTEEELASAAQCSRSFLLETRIFVLDAGPPNCDVAVLTVARAHRRNAANDALDIDPCSVRLELGRVDPRGRWSAGDNRAFSIPFDGPSTLETGLFAPVPNGGNRTRTWEVIEANRPTQAWQVLGGEQAGGVACLKLLGVQQSDDWDSPRADRSAWRRQDTLWVIPGQGIAYRLERTFERREAAHRQPTHRSTTQYTLDSRMIFPGQLCEARCREISAVRALAEATEPLLNPSSGRDPHSFAPLQKKIAYHLENFPGTPYRDVLLHLQQRIDAYLRGEMSAADPSEDAEPVSRVAAPDRRVPDFVATDLTHKKSIRLRDLRGQPVILIFYTPGSKTAGELLRFAQSVHDRFADRVHVVGLAVSGDADAILRQHQELHLSFPVLAGDGLRLSFDVEATPKFVVLDASGILRGQSIGWGLETPGLVVDETEHCLNRAAGAAKP